MTEESVNFAAYEAVAATLQTYIESARSGDGARMRTAFLDDATVRGSYGGKPTDWTVPAFCAVIDKGGPAADLRGSAAMARLEAANWRGTRYTDFFVLIERAGAWRIASKVFFAHARA